MRRALPLLLAAFALALALEVGAQEKDAKKKGFVPTEDELTPFVLEVLRSYPTDGPHTYYWPKGSTWTGTTRDLFYERTRVCDADPEKSAFCCGLTWEVFFRAWEL